MLSIIQRGVLRRPSTNTISSREASSLSKTKRRERPSPLPAGLSALCREPALRRGVLPLTVMNAGDSLLF